MAKAKADKAVVPAPEREPRPTEAALRKKPRAVVIAEWHRPDGVTGTNLSDVETISHTFEWFQNEKPQEVYYNDLFKYAHDLVNDDHDDPEVKGETFVFIGTISDTSTDPIAFDAWEVFGAGSSDVNEYKAMIAGHEQGPGLFLIPSPKRGDGTKKPRTVRPKVKGRKPSPAAEILKGKVESKPERKKPVKAVVKPRRKNVDMDEVKARLKDELAEVVTKATEEATKAAEEAVATPPSALVHMPRYKALRPKVR